MLDFVYITDDFGGGNGDSGSSDYTTETKYWIYVVINEYYEGLILQKPFVKLVSNFGSSLGAKAQVLIPLEGHYSKTRRSVLKADWEEKMWEQLDKATDLYMLVLPYPLSSFKPNNDNFILMWLPDALANPAQYLEILKDIANEINNDRDIFQWHSKKTNKFGKILKKIDSSVSAKPGIFGFSIDLKELLKK